MHVAVKLECDKTSALELPAYEPEEIDYWLNNSIRKFGKTRYGGMNVKSTSFEETQKRIDDLRTLIENVTVAAVSSTASDYPNGYRWDLPSDYWFALAEEANITVSATTTRVGIVECTIDEYRQRLDDPYSEHKLHYTLAKPLRLFNGNTVELISDGNYTVDDYYLTYFKKPQEVDVANVASGSIVAGTTYGVYNTDGSYVTYNSINYYSGSTFIGLSGTTTYTESGTSTVNTSCNLPEHTHDEIVKLAVSMMLENIEQPRYQTYQNEVNTIE